MQAQLPEAMQLIVMRLSSVHMAHLLVIHTLKSTNSVLKTQVFALPVITALLELSHPLLVLSELGKNFLARLLVILAQKDTTVTKSVCPL